MQHDQVTPPPADVGDEATERFLIYALGDEWYGSHLVGIKEVIKIGAINPVPYMVPHFRGVINLRGQIISIVDLRLKFGLPVKDANKGLILVVENQDRHLGVIADDVIAVTTVKQGEIAENPSLLTKIPVDFFIGVAKFGERLVNLVDIGACLTSEEYALIQRAKETTWKSAA